ncbi:DUF6056 family protein [Streptomyces niveus]|uniref:DUF6056 family protein n=1 Tax=Streptomyces niveus TaxID=193462 RepID=UPI00366558B3
MEKFYFVDNGRVANAVLVWSYARFGVAGQQWFGLFSGVLVLALLWAFIATALPRAGMRVPRGVPFLVASIVTVLFLLGSPNTYKTFYWPAASVSHTLPPVLACAAVIPVLRATSQRGRVLALLTVFVAGLILGTLSEETSVVAVVVLASALLISGRLFPEARRRFLRLCCAAGITGTVIGTLILFTSPGAQHRRERHYTVSALAPETLLASLRGFAHIVITCLTTWQYLGAVAAGVLLALLARAPRSGLTPMKNQMLCAGAGAGALLVSGYLCTVITYPAFGPTVATSTRLWNDYLLLYILFLVFLGTLLARAWRHRMRRTGPAMATGAGVFALVCLSLAGSLTQPRNRHDRTGREMGPPRRPSTRRSRRRRPGPSVRTHAPQRNDRTLRRRRTHRLAGRLRRRLLRPGQRHPSRQAPMRTRKPRVHRRFLGATALVPVRTQALASS